VIISSVPGGAEISVGEKFRGNPLAGLKLPAGSHAMVLNFPGRAGWKRTLEAPKSRKGHFARYLGSCPLSWVQALFGFGRFDCQKKSRASLGRPANMPRKSWISKVQPD